MHFLITGATGFVGRALTQQVCDTGGHVTALVRSQTPILPMEANQIVVGDLEKFAGSNKSITDESFEQLFSAIQNVDVVIHTAARAHVMKEDQDEPAAIYHLMNVALTEKLALAAAQAGVKRFVFISSIKVNGEKTVIGPFTEKDSPAPEDDYGRSKWQAEQILKNIGLQTGMEIVILRPPLVYGPGVKGNFASLIRVISKVPLPFGAIDNRRSLLALDNLVSAILLVSKHPAAANQTFLLADDEVVSTSQLIKLIAQAQGKQTKLIPVPVSWMKLAAALLGRTSAAERLFGSLQIDASKIRKTLGWKPVITMSHQMEKIFSQAEAEFPRSRG